MRHAAHVLVGGLVLLAGCHPGDDGDGPITADDRLLDPKTCEECHPQHYREWLGSMHAYAGEDPVFRAMNARGQRETNGALGDFCVQCHAPLAVELGLTTDGLNLDELPDQVKGVTCYFCHTTESVEGTHNNPLVLTGKRILFGAISDPVENDVHGSAYSALLDGTTVESARACGSCHDIVNDKGVHLERTFAEWQESFFSDIDPLSGELQIYGQSCATCHFGRGIEGPIADFPGVRGDRKRHDHSLVGVDVTLTDFPDATLGPELRAEQLEHIEEQRKSALCATICVNPAAEGGSDVDVWLHNEFSAHGWPSGANQDRRAWLELHAWAGEDEVLTTGVVPPGTAVAHLDDPLLWLFRDAMYDGAGNEVHMFWEAESYESAQLPASEVLSPQGDVSTWRARRFHVEDGTVDRVTTAVRIRPMGLEVLDDLVQSGDLDPAIRDAMPVFDVAPTVLEWTPAVAEEFEGYGPCVSSSDRCGAPIVGAPPPEG